MKLHRSPNKLNLKRPSPRHAIKKKKKHLSNQRQKENLKRSKKKDVFNLQENPHKAIGEFLNRNYRPREREREREVIFKIIKVKEKTLHTKNS